MKVYLSGPIYPDNREATDAWREQAHGYLNAHSIETLDPCRGKAVYQYNVFTPLEIVYRDLRDIDHSDVLLVNFNLVGDKIPAGTLMEIQYAWMKQKPCIVVCTDPRLKFHPWILAMSVRIFQTLGEALDYTVNFWGE